MKIVVIGGSGLIGSAVIPLLRHHGQEAVPASRRTGVNSVTGAGLTDALAGASVVIDVADSLSLEDDAAWHFFETSTRNLLAAEAAAGVGHHVALSVVGADRLSEIGYFRAKLAQENLVMSSPVPFTIVRATQFFEFLMRIADAATEGDAVRLAPVLVQPIAAADVAAVLGRVAVGTPANGVVEIAGPERFRFDELVWDDLSARDDPRSVVTDERARHFGALLSERSLVPGAGAWLGHTRFADWLRHHRSLLAAEVALVESSHLEEATLEPIANWRFDPAEAQWYGAVLHDLREAVVHGKRGRTDAEP